MERALRRIAAAHPDQTVAVFSHGTAIRQALARIKGIPPEEWHGLRHSDNTAVSCLKWDGAAFQLAFEGTTPTWTPLSPHWPASPGGGGTGSGRRT